MFDSPHRRQRISRRWLADSPTSGFKPQTFLPATHAKIAPVTPFRINTCGSASKQTTLTSFAIIQLQKNQGPPLRHGSGKIHRPAVAPHFSSTRFSEFARIPSSPLASRAGTRYAKSLPMNRIYLDHNATTPVDPAVLDAMLPYFSAEFGNAASIHAVGQRARAAVETAHEQVAALLGARPQEIVFTSGGTESDNHAIFGILRSTPGATKHIITTAIEHEAVLNTCGALEKEGASVTYLPVGSNGIVNTEELRDAIRPHTALISIMHANNELGTIQPLAEIGHIATQNDIYFHTDAVQSVGKIPVDVKTLGVDLLSLSGHKCYAPKGVGALYIRTGTRLKQLLFGGQHQRGFRPGTENVPGIVGLGKAAELARLSLAEDAARIGSLRDQLEQGLVARIPDTHVNAAASARTPNTSNITFSGIGGEALVIALDIKGIACSTGAACSSGALDPSHVLTAIGISAEDARSGIRFSLGRHTTSAEIECALEAIPTAVAQLRELSPTYQKEAATPR
jgi:cysteine desulfurase